MYQENFPHKVDSGFIIELSGTTGEASLSLVQQPAKQVLCLVPPTPPCGFQAQDFGISKMK
jgi:hypothetical protein